MTKTIFLAAVLLGYGATSWAAPPPKATEANLIPEVEELASLMADEQNSSGLEGNTQFFQMCQSEERAPDCRTLVLFNVGNFTGNSTTQYLAMFDPVDSITDYDDLPDVVKQNSKFLPWKFISVIKIDGTGEVIATFSGAKVIANKILLEGLAHGPKDNDSEYSARKTVQVTLLKDVLSRVEISK